MLATRRCRCSSRISAHLSAQIICFGAQDPIWHHCEKLSRRVLNHHQLGHYKPGTFAGSAHQVNDVPFPDTLVYWEPSWPTSVCTTRNTVIKLGWSRIGLAVIVLQAAGIGLIGRPVVISGLYDKCRSLQLQNHHAHFPPLQETHIHANTTMRNWWWKMKHCFEALYAGRGRRNTVWSGKESHCSLRGWMDGWLDGRTDGRTNRQTDGRTDRQIDDMLPMGHSQVLPPLCPLQTVVSTQHGLQRGMYI